MICFKFVLSLFYNVWYLGLFSLVLCHVLNLCPKIVFRKLILSVISNSFFIPERLCYLQHRHVSQVACCDFKTVIPYCNLLKYKTEYQPIKKKENLCAIYKRSSHSRVSSQSFLEATKAIFFLLMSTSAHHSANYFTLIFNLHKESSKYGALFMLCCNESSFPSSNEKYEAHLLVIKHLGEI